MLRTALEYAEDIRKELCEYQYSTDLMYFQRANGMSFSISESYQPGEYKYAVVKSELFEPEELLGVVAYNVDLTLSRVHNFRVIAFKQDDVFNEDMHKLIRDLLYKYHSIELKAIEGDPLMDEYLAIVQEHIEEASVVILRDAFKDIEGKLRDVVIFEFVKETTRERAERDMRKTKIKQTINGIKWGVTQNEGSSNK